MKQTKTTEIMLSIDESNLKSIIKEQKNENNISYTKVKKISFVVVGLHFEKIPVLTSIKVSFYEKYSLLILQKGVFANNHNELINKLSILLNINEKCVEEFIDLLNKNAMIDFDENLNKFVLKNSIHFIIDPEKDDAMFADLDIKEVECKEIIFIDRLNKLCLEKDINKEYFRKKGVQNNEENLFNKTAIYECVQKNNTSIEGMIKNAFDNTNMHLADDITYQLVEDDFRPYRIELDVVIVYEYDKKRKKSYRKEIKTIKDLFLPEDFVWSLTEEYENDDVVPRFISLEDNFYKKILSDSDNINEIEKQIKKANNEVESIAEKIDERKKEIDNAKKDCEIVKKEVEVECADIRDRLSKNDNDINNMTQIIKENNNNKIKSSFITSIRELKTDKKELEKKLKNKQQEMDKILQEYKEKKEALESKIVKLEQDKKDNKEKIKVYKNDLLKKSKEYNDLINKNQSCLNPVINSVIKKYPSTNSELNRNINELCIEIDSALSASEVKNFSEMQRNIDRIREQYRKTFQVVLENILNIQKTSLGSYFLENNMPELDKLFKNRKIPLDIKDNLIKFHALTNAIGHCYENGPKKEENNKRIKEFEELNNSARAEVLLGIPNFFNTISFSKTEIDRISSRMNK